MSVRAIVLALLLSCGMAAAVGKHPKPPKVHKHAVTTPKGVKHSKQANKGVKHTAPKRAKHQVSTPKVAKHKVTKLKKHRA
jgi:hypothetical protein